MRKRPKPTDCSANQRSARRPARGQGTIPPVMPRTSSCFFAEFLFVAGSTTISSGSCQLRVNENARRPRGCGHRDHAHGYGRKSSPITASAECKSHACNQNPGDHAQSLNGLEPGSGNDVLYCRIQVTRLREYMRDRVLKRRDDQIRAGNA